MPAHWITYRYTTGPGTAVAAIHAPHLVDVRIDPADQAAARNLFDPPRHLPPMPS